MKSILLVIVLVAALTSAGQVASAEVPTDEKCKEAWSDAWAHANALEVMDDFQRLYQRQASILLEAEQRVSDGVDSSLRREFEALPGVSGWLWGNLKDFQSSDTSLKEGIVMEFLMNRTEASTKEHESPMTHRNVYKGVHFIRMRFPNVSYNLMVHYIAGKPPLPPRGVIALILDRNWLVQRVPSEMDSLAHESLQLLFWAPWKKNTFVQQSLGVIAGADTLWWWGSKDVKVRDIQGLSQPFPDIEIHSFVRKL